MSSGANPKVSFTGFGFDKEPLKAFAGKAGYWLVQTVPRDLKYLVVGDDPTEWKVEKARSLGVPIVTLSEFEKITGVKFEEPPPLPSRRMSPGDISMAAVGAPGICSKAHLFRLAEKAGFFVFGYGAAIPKSLSILVVGDSKGTLTEERARKNGARIMSPQEFITYVEKGINRDELKQYRAKAKGKASPPAISTQENIILHGPDESEALKEFQVLIAAITCDQQLTRDEFDHLCKWLVRHDALSESPVLRPVFELASSVLEDGVVTQDELDSMLRLLSGNGTPRQDAVASVITVPDVDPLAPPIPPPSSKKSRIRKGLKISCGCLILIAIALFILGLIGMYMEKKKPVDTNSGRPVNSAKE